MSSSNNGKQKQAKAYQLLTNDHQFYLRTTSKQFSLFSGIKINRLTSKITKFSSQQQFIDEVSTNTSSAIKSKQFIDLILGLLIINHQPYLLICTQTQSIGILESDRIYQIKNIKSIPFKHKFLYNSYDQSQNEKILGFIKEIVIKENFYFCYKEDITLTRTKHEDKQNTQVKYCWNQSLLDYFKKSKLPQCWTIPVIQGHVRQIHCQNQYFTFYYLIISRRSKQMSGTRFNHRGIDKKYNAANFVQTEQIFICHNYLFSHVSLRGSVPVYWLQENVKSDIVFNHKHQYQQVDVFRGHYKMLEEEYKGKICTINLLSKVKSPEKDLKAVNLLYFIILCYLDILNVLLQNNKRQILLILRLK